MFFKGSRYAKVDTAEITKNDGRVVRYKKTRFIATPKTQYLHHVSEGERLDHIAHDYYRNAERFWRICDANEVLWPDELTATPGRLIKIPRSTD